MSSRWVSDKCVGKSLLDERITDLLRVLSACVAWWMGWWAFVY